MGELFLYSADGQLLFGYNAQGENIHKDCHLLYAAAQRFLQTSNNQFTLSSPSGKKVGISPTNKGEILIYISDGDISSACTCSYLKLQRIMLDKYFGYFVKPIHISGIHLNTVFGVPQVFLQPKNQDLENFLTKVQTAINSPLVAIYNDGVIMTASNDFWKLNKQDLFAIDTLVRLNEAPFSDQSFSKRDGASVRVVMYHVISKVKIVSVVGGAFNLPQTASSALVPVLYEYSQLINSMNTFVPITNKELNVRAWAIVDNRVTPVPKGGQLPPNTKLFSARRFFCYVPKELEADMIRMASKVEEVSEKDIVTDISMRINESKFFYMPKVQVTKKGALFSTTKHVWDLYILHDLDMNIETLRQYSSDTMSKLTDFLKYCE